MSTLNVDRIGAPTLMSDGNLSIGCDIASNTTTVFGHIAEVNIGSMVGTGTTTADANTLSYTHNIVSGSAAASGVRLPDNLPTGTRIFVINRGAGGLVKVYPPTGGQIDLLGANNPVSLAYSNSAGFLHEGSNKWFTLASK